MDPTTLALANAGIQIGSTALSNFGQQGNANAQYDALTNYLQQMDAQRQAAKTEIQGNYNTADSQMQNLLNTQLPELGQMKSDINQQATDAQQNNAAQEQSQLAQQGVRGGQAATLQGRQQGQLNRELNYDQNQLGYQEAQNRQNAALNYTGQKGLIPYNTLNSAQWLNMPSATEQAMMSQAINGKFNVASPVSSFANSIGANSNDLRKQFAPSDLEKLQAQQG